MGMIRCGAQDGTQSVALVVTLDEVPLTPAIIIGAEALRRLPRRSLPLSCLRLLCPLERVVCPKAILRDPLPIFVAHPFLQGASTAAVRKVQTVLPSLSLPTLPLVPSLHIAFRIVLLAFRGCSLSFHLSDQHLSHQEQAERLDLFSVP